MPLTRASALGLAAVVLSAGLMIWSLAGHPNPFERQYTIWADLPDAATIIRFDRDVRLAGVNVGTVGKVERRGDRARVQLKLDPDMRGAIRTDAQAELRPHTLFEGNSFVDLKAGSASAAALPEGATIPRDRTRSAVSLDKALRTLGPRTRGDLTALTASARRILGARQQRALRHTITTAPPLLRDTAAWARAVQGPGRSELTGAIRGLSATADALGPRSGDLTPMLRSAARTARAIDADEHALDRTLRELPAALRASRTGGVSLRRTIAALTPLAGDLTPALRELDPTLRELRPVLRRASPVLRRARPLTADLRAVLRASDRAASPTIALLRALLPPVRIAEDTVVPFLRSRTDLGPSVAEALGAMAAGATGTLAPVQDRAQGGRSGAGHAFYLSASSSSEVGCDDLPSGSTADVMRQLGICTP